MLISVDILGTVREYFVRESFTVTLEEGARYSNLLLALEKELKEGGQPYWNFEKHAFRGPMLVAVEGTIIRDTATPLCDGQQVTIKRFLIGG